MRGCRICSPGCRSSAASSRARRTRCCGRPTWTAPRPSTSTPPPITARRCSSNGAWVAVDQSAHGCRARRSTRQRTAVRVSCKKLRDIRKGDLVVCGMQGIRVSPDVQSRDKPTFGFMSNEVSSERRVETAVKRVAEMMRRVKADGGRIAFVAGPVDGAHRRLAVLLRSDSSSATSTCCSRATRSPCTTSRSRSRARRSASISAAAIPSSTAIAITCARSTPCAAPAASAGRSRPAC